MFKLALSLLLLAPAALAHSKILAVSGSNGVKTTGFGISANTVLDGSNNDQKDVTTIRQATGCGQVVSGGQNDISAGISAALATGNGQLPSVAANGQVSLTLHQTNGDGAGPYTCEVSADATGNNFVAMQVVTQVPGQNGASGAKATDFPLVAAMPAGVACSGGPNKNACVVRCKNPPGFGGCVPVQNGGAATGQAAGQGNNGQAAQSNNGQGGQAQDNNGQVGGQAQGISGQGQAQQNNGRAGQAQGNNGQQGQQQAQQQQGAGQQRQGGFRQGGGRQRGNKRGRYHHHPMA